MNYRHLCNTHKDQAFKLVDDHNSKHVNFAFLIVCMVCVILVHFNLPLCRRNLTSIGESKLFLGYDTMVKTKKISNCFCY